jgi:hypothetical protein
MFFGLDVVLRLKKSVACGELQKSRDLRMGKILTALGDNASVKMKGCWRGTIDGDKEFERYCH